MIRAGTSPALALSLACVLACALAAGDAAAQSSGSNAVTGALRGITSLFNRGNAAPTTLATSTIGIRGLGAEDIANAQPNLAAVGQMEALRQDEAQARRFAADAALAPVAVTPLPAPPRAATAGTSPGNSPAAAPGMQVAP